MYVSQKSNYPCRIILEASIANIYDPLLTKRIIAVDLRMVLNIFKLSFVNALRFEK